MRTKKTTTPPSSYIEGLRTAYLNMSLLIDFIPSVNPRSERDLAILHKWKSYFRKIGTPYLVMRKSGKFILWKELSNG